MYARPRTLILKRERGGRGRPSNEQMKALGEQMSRVVQADLKGSLESWCAKADYDKVAKAVYSGNWRKVRAQLPIKSLPDFFKEGLKGLRESMTKSSRMSAKQLKDAALRSDISPNDLLLDARNPKVDEYIETRTGMLVENVDENLQVNIQRAIKDGINNNKSPNEVASTIRDGLVLNSRQEQALANYTANLTSAGDLSARQIERASSEYRERLLTQRSMAIARTETSYAQNAAQMMVWKDAQDNGLLSKDAYKVWVVDGDPCLICQDLSGAQVRLDQTFVTAVGDELDSPPAHPNCLCYLTVSSED